MHVRRDDLVQVMAGADRGKFGRVLRTIPEEGKVVVEGVNLRWKHLRKGPKNPQGGRVRREFPIASARILLRCERCGGGRRARTRLEEERKVRICAKCGAELGGK
ncbi:MAG TPA: 50S ribosomal protein L24 [Planctomycetota bacterium]|jgi:large subunit ribosomal protein L24|nr:50S ribosomal protein L24 [Planctomycetota bacterium]